jgi:hypothetical protein
MHPKRLHITLGALALVFALFGLFVTFGYGALADPDRNPASENSSKGLMFERLGF